MFLPWLLIVSSIQSAGTYIKEYQNILSLYKTCPSFANIFASGNWREMFASNQALHILLSTATDHFYSLMFPS